MTAVRHVILRQVVEVTVAEKRFAPSVQDSVSRIFRSRGMSILERSCDQVSLADTVHRVERLEVDLGRLPLQGFEEALDAALESAIGPSLARAVANAEAQAGGRLAAEIRSHFELLELFVRSGNLPWWADASHPSIVADSLRFLSREAPADLKARLRVWLDHSRVFHRCILVCPDAVLEELLLGFGSVPDVALSLLARELLVLSPISGHQSGTKNAGIRPAIWQVMFRAASRSSRSDSEAKEWARDLLLVVSSKLGIGVDELIAQLRVQLEKKSSSSQLQVDRLLPLLPRNLSPRETSLIRPANSESAAEGATHQESGTLRAEEPSLETGVGFETSLEGLSDLQPTKEMSTDATRQNRVETQEPTLVGSPSEPPSGGESPALGRFSEVSANRQISSFSNLDVVYVGNAGLVILWPFLATFFQHLGFVREKRFRDEAARQRAIGLLQYLATEDRSPAEYELSLNKVLCGLPAAEVFDFGEPVGEMEVAECHQLLEAVIAQAPILGKMSLSGFRGTFLRRNGQLSVRDEAWLLRVERETYDVVLERFPWAWGWVRLPWMSASLRVEWL